MHTISVSELEHNLGLYLEKVRDGDEIVIEDGDETIALLVPFATDEDRLVAENLMTLPKRKLAEDFWETDAPEVAPEMIADAIRAERDED